MKHQKNNFCVCGHLEKEHWESGKGRCYFDGMSKEDLLFIREYKEKGCKCIGFKLDNLKYLEMLYEEKTAKS